MKIEDPFPQDFLVILKRGLQNLKENNLTEVVLLLVVCGETYNSTDIIKITIYKRFQMMHPYFAISNSSSVI